MNNTYYFNANNYFNNDIQLFATNLTPKELMSYNFVKDKKTKLKAIKDAKNSLVICSNTQGCGIVSITYNSLSNTYNMKLITPIINENYLNKYYEFDVKNFIDEQNTDEKLVYLDTIAVSGTNIHKMFLNSDNLVNAYNEIIDNCKTNNDDILNLSGSYAQLSTQIDDLSKQIDSLNNDISHLPANFASDINSLEQSISKLEDAIKKIDGDELLTSEEIEYIKTEISGIYDKISGCNNYYGTVIESINTLSGINSNMNDLRYDYANIKNIIQDLDIENLISEYTLNNLKDDDDLYKKLQEYIKKILSSAIQLDYKTLLNAEVKELLQNLYSKENIENEDENDNIEPAVAIWNVYGGRDENGYYVWSENNTKIYGKWYTHHKEFINYSWVSGLASKLASQIKKYVFLYEKIAWCFVPNDQNSYDEPKPEYTGITGIDKDDIVTGPSGSQTTTGSSGSQITGSNSQTTTGSEGGQHSEWPLTPTSYHDIIYDSTTTYETLVDPVEIDSRYGALHR